jgi:hypothetical protein
MRNTLLESCNTFIPAFFKHQCKKILSAIIKHFVMYIFLFLLLRLEIFGIRDIYLGYCIDNSTFPLFKLMALVGKYGVYKTFHCLSTICVYQITITLPLSISLWTEVLPSISLIRLLLKLLALRSVSTTARVLKMCYFQQF